MKFVVESEDLLGSKIYDVIAPDLKSGAVFALEGDLGAGKTALVKQIAKRLGIETPVTSPTFSIIKRYPIKGKKLLLQHFDLYRFDSFAKSDENEILEMLAEENTVSFIEWPQRVPNLKKIVLKTIKIKQVDQNMREVEIV